MSCGCFPPSWKAELTPEVYKPINDSVLRTLGEIGTPLTDLMSGENWQSGHALHELEGIREVVDCINEGAESVLERWCRSRLRQGRETQLPEFDVEQYWHECFHNDPGNAWLRRMIARALARHDPASIIPGAAVGRRSAATS